MVIVGRHIYGITLNPLEYLLDKGGNVMEFENEDSAKAFLKENGLTDDEIYWLAFEQVIDKPSVGRLTFSIKEEQQYAKNEQ